MIIRSAASDRLGKTFTTPGKGFLYGGDYNPEQWSEQVWLQDAELMQQAGVNVVSLGVFAWGKLEVADNVFDFGWMDRVFAILHEHGIAVTLATPTAAPPMWLIEAHPEIMTTDASGIRTGQGGRLGWSPSSATFRRYALRMVAAGHALCRSPRTGSVAHQQRDRQRERVRLRRGDRRRIPGVGAGEVHQARGS